jgi:serine/threonine protein kinase
VNYAYAFKRDVFSVGAITYTMLCGRLPYKSEVIADLQAEMLQPMHFRGSAWEGVSKEAREFVTYLCTYSPKQRPCAKEALRHVWLRRLHEQRIAERRRCSTPGAALGDRKTSLMLPGLRLLDLHVDRNPNGDIVAKGLVASPHGPPDADYPAPGRAERRKSTAGARVLAPMMKRAASEPGLTLNDVQETEVWGANSFFV